MEQFKKWISSYCEGTISDAEAELLEQELERSAEARQYLRDYLNIDAGLQETMDQKLDEADPLAAHQSNEKKQKTNYWKYAAILVVALNIALLLVWKKAAHQDDRAPIASDPQETEEFYGSLAVAQLTRVVDVNWGTGIPHQRGSEIKPGTFKFSSGLVQLEFFSGATMVLEGPAEIELKTKMEVICLNGKMHVKVPESAHGFVVDTGKMKVHDLGTEFCISVNGDNREIHVLEGEVEISQEGQRLRHLHKSDAVAWGEQDAQFNTVNVRDDFVTYRDIGQYDDAYTKKRQQEWREYMDELSQREDLILLYDFDAEANWQRVLPNRAARGMMEGAIIGAKWTEGRWQNKKGIEFKSVTDRICLNVRGTYDALTMACWIRVDSFDRWLSSLLLSDGFEKGTLHWQLSDSGEMIVGARHKAGGGAFENIAYNVFSPEVIQPSDFGRWMHLAMVYDPVHKKINQYIDGELIYSGEIKVLQKIHIGKCQIGNWNRSQLRSLNGCMDEFMIFSRALNHDQIKELYLHGKP